MYIEVSDVRPSYLLVDSATPCALHDLNGLLYFKSIVCVIFLMIKKSNSLFVLSVFLTLNILFLSFKITYIPGV